jgi:predicted porin
LENLEMKKTLVALAALAAAGVASAQSSVTLFGIADISYTNLNSTGAGSLGQLTGSGRNASSRLGFRGTEDLGGGLSAGFWLEAGVNVNTGAGSATTTLNSALGDKVLVGASIPNATLNGTQGLTFNRRSTLSLSGSWGELRLGRDYTPTFWNMTTKDPFGTVGVGSATVVQLGTLNPFNNGTTGGSTQIRTSNSIQYLGNFPTSFGAVYGQVMVGLSNIPSNCTTVGVAVAGANACLADDGDGELWSGRIGTTIGAFDISFAYSQTKFSDTAANGPAGTPPILATSTGGTIANINPFKGTHTVAHIAATYDAKSWKLWAQAGYQDVDQTGGSNSQGGKLTHYMLALTVPFGSTEFKAAYSYGEYNRNGIAAPAAGAWEDGSTSKHLSFGAVYNLSKRTALYGTISQLDVTGQNTRANFGGLASAAATVVGGSNTSTGVDIGMRHAF